MPTQQEQKAPVSQPRSPTLKAALRRLQRQVELKVARLQREVTLDSVHQARTAARRLRALLRAYRAQLSPVIAHRYRHWLKRVIGELGPLRDADVAEQNIKHLAAAARGRRRRALDALSAKFEQRRDRLACKLHDDMTGSKWSRNMQKLKLAAAAALISPNSPPIGSLTESLLAHCRRRMRARLRKVRRSEHALHRLRLKVKRLRYLLEESPKCGAGLGNSEELRLLKSLQDCLGQIHDLAVLKDLSMDAASPRAARKVLSNKCASPRRRLLTDFDESRAALLRVWRAVG